jgi:uncharacterized protein YndB with AHSA1/START domain
MKMVLKIVGAVLALLVAVVVLGGLMLKSNYRVERNLLIQAPPERIYALLDSSAGWQRWGVWYRRDPKMAVTASGAASGTGAAWAWTSESQGNGRMQITAAEPQRRVAYTLQIDDFAPATGELRLELEAGGTRVVWQMQGDMGANPISRWFGLFMDKMVGPDFEGGLKNLQELAEKKN